MKKYKNLWYFENSGNKEEIIEGKKYYRYMDKIYIPNKVDKLSLEDTKSLSEIRVKLDNNVIDYNYSKSINKYLLSKINKNNRKNIIDFGCGAGFLLHCIDEKYGVRNYYGLDCTNESLMIAYNTFMNKSDFSINFNEFNKDTKIDLKNNTVDSIISCFVMHFNIFDEQLEELHRVLKKTGQFVYNDFYHKIYPKNTELVINKLSKLGFSVKTEIKNIKQDNQYKSHLIIIATKN